jgi:uncharacterized protein
MNRAVQFYERVFDCVLSRQLLGDTEMAWFPGDQNGQGSGGTLIMSGDHYTPSHKGTLVYFSSEDAAIELGRVEDAGGLVLQLKTEITPEIGYMGLFEDSEGNRIAIHSLT